MGIRLRGAPDPHRFWLGQDIRDRRVILRCLHGYGDAVQFLRYAPRLRELAAHLVVEVPPALVEIASCFDGVHDVISWEGQAKGNRAWDVQVEIMELPYLFRTEACELPLAERYLRLPEARFKATLPFRGSGSYGPRAAGTWTGRFPLICCGPCSDVSVASSGTFRVGPRGVRGWGCTLAAQVF